jgi:uncharacterized repeat protein (TIGR01451 family)
MAEEQTSKYFYLVTFLKIGLICLYLTYQPTTIIAQETSRLPASSLKTSPTAFNNLELADACDNPFEVTSLADTFDIVPTVIVVANKSGEESKIAACVNIQNPGFYRVSAKIAYSDSSKGQNNESFYLQVCNEDSTICTNPCDANAGPYKVVEDMSAKGDTLTRDAGVFYFNAGHNIIMLNHYVLIADDFPEFVNDQIKGPESVHLLQLILEFYELALSQSASENTVQPGDVYSYSLNIENLGSATAYDLNLWDAIPGSLITPIKFTLVPPDSVTPDTLFWRFDSLTSGEKVNIEFDVKVVESLNDSLEIVNVSQLTTGCDTIYASTTVMVSPAPRNYDLKLTKTVSPDTVFQVDEFVYNLKIENLGPNKANDITLWDTVPDSVLLLNFTLEPINSINADTLFWHFDSLSPGDFLDLEFTAKVPASLELPVSPFERANKSWVTAKDDTNNTNNRDSTSVYVVLPNNYDLKLTKTASPENVPEGNEFSYMISIVNLGPNTATEITLWDAFPEFLTLSDFNPQPVSTTQDTVFWFFDSLAPLDSIIIVFKAKVTKPLPETPYELRNTSRLSAPQDVNEDNNTANSVVIVVPTNDCIVLDRNVFEPDRGIPLGLNFKLSTARRARLDVYDVTGYHITKLVERTFNAGLNTYSWDGMTENGDRVGSGVYIITLRSEQFVCWKKVIVVR